MIFRQIIHNDLGCASYLVGDERARVAAVVDPRLDIEEYLALASYLGVRIDHVLESHNHADHVSGHGHLVAATGAIVHIHRLAAAQYAHEPFDDGWELALGDVSVLALHTPGHRPEHTSFALIDRARGSSPWAVLTGDSLFVGDVARPDLAIDKTEGARGIFHSLHDKLLALPGECEVWPGHLGGSLCGGPAMDLKICSTIAFERAHNDLLALGDEEAFTRRTTSALGPQPPNFEAIVARNRGPLRSSVAEPQAFDAQELRQRGDDGALLVDVRPDAQYDAAHVPGALCNPAVRAGFGTKLAWIVERGREIVIIGRADVDALRAAALAAAVGIDDVSGYLEGGMTGWQQQRLPTASVRRIDVPALHAAADELQLLDVRERSEWEAGHIPGSVHVPYHDLRSIPQELDATLPIAVICSSGQRSAVAASLLLHHGGEDVIHVTDGGVGTWEQHGWPVERAG